MKKLSIQEKKLRGTFDPSKVRKLATFDLLTEIPEPTQDLAPDELAYFRACCEAMISNHTLSGAYIPGISRAARMYGIYLQALKDIQVHGCYQTTQSGYTAKNGYFQVLTDAEKSLTAFERSNGLNLASFSKLPEQPAPKKSNPFDEI